MEFQKLSLLLEGKTGIFFIGYLKTESMLLIKRFLWHSAAGSDNVFVQIASVWNIFMCLDTGLYGKDSAKERHIKEKRFFFFRCMSECSLSYEKIVQKSDILKKKIFLFSLYVRVQPVILLLPLWRFSVILTFYFFSHNTHCADQTSKCAISYISCCMFAFFPNWLIDSAC